MSEFPDLRQPSAFDPTIKVGQTTPNLPTDPQPVRETAPVPEDLQEKLEAATICADSRDCLACMDTIALIKRIAQEKARVRELEHRCKVFVKGLENEEEDCGALHDQIEALEQRAAKAEAIIEKLKDSATVHSNILRGTIALTKAQAIHIAGLPANIEQQVARLSASVTHIEYDSECGSAYIYFQPERKGEPAVVAETVVANLDIDNEGRIYGIEVLDLSEKEATVLLAARVSASSDVKGDGDGKS